MPDYSYNKDYPFAAFITNLGKYKMCIRDRTSPICRST